MVTEISLNGQMELPRSCARSICHEAIPAIPEQCGELRRACRARQGRADLQALQADGGRLAGAGTGAGLARRPDAAASQGVVTCLRHCEERWRRPVYACCASYAGFKSAEALSAKAEAIHRATSGQMDCFASLA